MQIQSGKLYENRTWKYYYPCLKHYGENLTKWLSNFLKVAVGIGDSNRDDKETAIYILIDTNISLTTDKQIQSYKDKFAQFLNWVKYQDYYVGDYIYEKDLHMVVIKVPDKFVPSYTEFIKGNYSKMYNKLGIKQFFKYVNIPNKEIELKQNEKLKIVRSILSKDKTYIKTFVKEVNERFKTNVSDSYFQEAELDFPPVREEEIFNI